MNYYDLTLCVLLFVRCKNIDVSAWNNFYYRFDNELAMSERLNIIFIHDTLIKILVNAFWYAKFALYSNLWVILMTDVEEEEKIYDFRC